MTGSARDDGGATEAADRLGGHLALWLSEQMWNEYGTLWLGDGKYRVGSAEDYEAWGYAGADVTGPTLLVREPDGQVFEVEVEVHARPVQTAQAAGSESAREKFEAARRRRLTPASLPELTDEERRVMDRYAALDVETPDSTGSESER